MCSCTSDHVVIMSSFVDTGGVKSVGQGGHVHHFDQSAVENLLHIHRKIGYVPTWLKKLW